MLQGIKFRCQDRQSQWSVRRGHGHGCQPTIISHIQSDDGGDECACLGTCSGGRGQTSGGGCIRGIRHCASIKRRVEEGIRDAMMGFGWTLPGR
eukprot:254670-Rhodomonas_salina.1